VEVLFRHATQEICDSVGFERAALFSLRSHTLVVESVYTAAHGTRLQAQLPSEPFQLGPWLHESEVVRRHRPVLVADAQGDQRALAMLPGARSYVAAPVICQGRAMGLLHADRGRRGRPVTELDRDTLATFAEGFGYALERRVLADRLRTQSERMLALVRSTEASVRELSEPDFELSASAPGAVWGGSRPRPRRGAANGAPAMQDPDLQALTRRELEVLGMLAEGETNARIAERLVVSDDTVKTHVKHILRKLGVHNRSQAVSRFFRSQAAELAGADFEPRGTA
jgi:DNA-binding CsgD family transcriptional regulator